MSDLDRLVVQIKGWPEDRTGLVFTDAECDAAERLLTVFLEAVPEIGIRSDHPNEQAIVDECYNGNVHDYIVTSFGNFLAACVDEPDMEVAGGEAEQEEPEP